MTRDEAIAGGVPRGSGVDPQIFPRRADIALRQEERTPFLGAPLILVIGEHEETDKDDRGEDVDCTILTLLVAEQPEGVPYKKCARYLRGIAARTAREDGLASRELRGG